MTFKLDRVVLFIIIIIVDGHFLKSNPIWAHYKHFVAFFILLCMDQADAYLNGEFSE